MSTEDDDSLLRKWCIEEEVDYSLACKIKSKIFPLLESAHKKLGYRFDKAIAEQIDGTRIRFENIKRIAVLLNKIEVTPNLEVSPEERAANFLHLLYLPMVEGPFSAGVNFVIFTLIANGHDLYVPWKNKYAKSFSDIESVSLSMRLKFLREHKLGIISNKCKINLRNSIAHLFYRMKENGATYVGKEKIDFHSVYKNLMHAAHSVNLIFRLYYRRFQTKYSKVGMKRPLMD